jgi:putative hemolysin
MPINEWLSTGWMIAATGGAGGGLLGWGTVDIPMLVCLPVLLVFSGFFSGSETALFGLNEAQRMSFRLGGSLADRAVTALLTDLRMLLITLLLGNMTANVLYFVISSVLMMRSSAGPVGSAAMALFFLMAIILAGEVAPKMLASAGRVRFAAIVSPLMLTIHRAIGPLRVVLNLAVIDPLSRLTAPRTAPPSLDDEELRALLDISGAEGVIDDEEQRMLRDVLGMRRLRVRDVMTPRLDVVALSAGAVREDVERITRAHRLTKVPIYERNLDHVLGVLHVKRYLLDSRAHAVTDPLVMSEAHFVPAIATLDQLLDHFQRWETKSAIVVDEYGGTEGVVAVEDVVEELVGDIVGADEKEEPPPRLVGLGRWLVPATLEVQTLAELFGIDPPETSSATVGVLVAEQLGRVPAVGDTVDLGPIRLEVETIARRRVASVIVSLVDTDADADAPDDPSDGEGAS